jgi:hypothetical protein
MENIPKRNGTVINEIASKNLDLISYNLDASGISKLLDENCQNTSIAICDYASKFPDSRKHMQTVLTQYLKTCPDKSKSKIIKNTISTIRAIEMLEQLMG